MLAALIKNADEDETEDEKDALNNSLTAMDWLQQLNGKDVGQSSSDCENEDSNHEEKNQPPYRSVKIREINFLVTLFTVAAFTKYLRLINSVKTIVRFKVLFFVNSNGQKRRTVWKNKKFTVTWKNIP